MELMYTADWKPSSNGNTVLVIGTYKATYWLSRDGYCWVVACDGHPVAQIGINEYAGTEEDAQAAAEAAIRNHVQEKNEE